MGDFVGQHEEFVVRYTSNGFGECLLDVGGNDDVVHELNEE
jgi:hypothetical protein